MGGNDTDQNNEKVNGENILSETAPAKYSTDNVSRMVERLLAQETTFFDHYRLKNLGGKIETSSLNGESQKKQIFPFKKGGQGNGNGHQAKNPLSPTNGNGSAQKAGANGNGKGASTNLPLARGEDGGSVTAFGPETSLSSMSASLSQSSKASKDGTNLSPTDPALSDQAQDQPDDRPPGQNKFLGLNSAEALGGLKKEPRWLISLKWLTRLFFSFIVLAWMFVLGFIVGRVTLTEPPDELSEKIQSSALGSFITQNLADLEDDIEPLDSDYPVVIVSPENDLAQNYPPPQSDYLMASTQSSASPLPAPAARARETRAQTPWAQDQSAQAPRDRALMAQAQSSQAQSDQTQSDQAPKPQVTSDQVASAQTIVASNQTEPSQASKAPSPAASTANKPGAANQEISQKETLIASAGSRLDGRGGPLVPETFPPQSPARAGPAVLDQAQKTGADQEYFWPAKPTKKGLFTIQVGAVGNEEAAKAMVKKFANQGFEDVYCYRTSSGRFNVRVGRYETEIQARTAAVALTVAGAYQPYLSKLNP
ncbi:MAG: SPOR domain-containing protein [Deltaproteobacteria bacterium]|jgi:hypothetical protein|nr:SPOR domain-containing protein [Deltaproteobacteria bacterium]